MSCYKHQGAASVRNVVKTVTGTPVTVAMWHGAARDVGRAAKSPALCEKDQAIAAAKDMFTGLHIDPNRNKKAQEFLDQIETGEVSLTKGQAEAMRRLPAEMHLVHEAQFISVPETVNETVQLLDDDLDQIEYEDHSGVIEDVGLADMNEVAGDLDPDSLEATHQFLTREFPDHSIHDLRFLRSTVNTRDLPSSSVDDYSMDGDVAADDMWDLVDAYARGDDIPPVIVVDHGDSAASPSGKRYDMVDGFHRTAAAKEAGIGELPAYVVSMENPTGNGMDGWATAADAADPMVAKNNCGPVTSAVHNHIVDQVGLPDGWKAGQVELRFPSGVHWAVTMTGPDGKDWVVDYSARQFDANADFPMVAPRDRWQWWVTDRIQTTYREGLVEAVDW